MLWGDITRGSALSLHPDSWNNGNRKMGESESFGFVKNNMEIFGFSSDDQAMRSAFLELLDNSIDAVLSVSVADASRVIDFSVTKSATEGEYRFVVIDNGIGMEESQIPLLCGGLFRTSKRVAQTASIGKYGVGIKAILLYYNTEVTISSSTVSEPMIATYQLGFEGSEVRVIHKKRTAKPTSLQDALSGTRITIDHIRGNASHTYAFLVSYLEHLFLVNPPFRLHLAFDSFPSLVFGRDALSSPSLSQSLSPSLSQSRREPLLLIFQQLFPAGKNCTWFSAHQEEDELALDCSLFVLPPSTRECSHDDRLSLSLLSFGNYKPLFNQSRECGLIAGVLHYPRWASYGMRMRYHGQGADRFVTLLDCGVEARERDGLVLVAHLHSSSPIRFTTLQKNSIQPSSTIDLLMKRCLDELLPRVRARDPLHYISRASSKRVMPAAFPDGQLLVYRDTIPSVANSVTNILALMDPAARRRCLAPLQWENRSLKQVEGEMIERMNAILQESITNKKQRRFLVC